MFEKLNFDAIDEKLEGSFGLPCDGFRTRTKLMCQAGRLEGCGGEKVEVDGKPMSESKGQ
jgi:hypothetical protein